MSAVPATLVVSNKTIVIDRVYTHTWYRDLLAVDSELDIGCSPPAGREVLVLLCSIGRGQALGAPQRAQQLLPHHLASPAACKGQRWRKSVVVLEQVVLFAAAIRSKH